MHQEDEFLKPLSFEEDDDDFGVKNRVFNTTSFAQATEPDELSDEFIPINKNSSNEIKNKDSNFVFFFGDAGTGKSVILAALLYYLRSQAGVLRPKLGTPNSKYAQVLLSDFFDHISRGILPTRSVRDEVIRMDLVFEPNNKSKKVPPINITFLESSGENHREIKRGGQFFNEIDAYLSANIPLQFIIVTSWQSAHKDDLLINEFLDELERKNKNLRSVNVLLVISQWDRSGRATIESNEELENFVNERLPMTAQRLDTYGLSKTFFTIGTVVKSQDGIDKITMLDLSTAEVIARWLYRSITGYDIFYEGTFWERIKFNFSK